MAPAPGVRDQFEATVTASFACDHMRFGRNLVTVYQRKPWEVWVKDDYLAPTVEVAVDDRDDQTQEARLFLCYTSPMIGAPVRLGMSAQHVTLLRARVGREGIQFLALQVSNDLGWVRRLTPDKKSEPPPYSPDDMDNTEGRKYIVCEVKGGSTAHFRDALGLLLRDPRLASIHGEIGNEEVHTAACHTAARRTVVCHLFTCAARVSARSLSLGTHARWPPISGPHLVYAGRKSNISRHFGGTSR